MEFYDHTGISYETTMSSVDKQMEIMFHVYVPRKDSFSREKLPRLGETVELIPRKGTKRILGIVRKTFRYRKRARGTILLYIL